jgi:hypothetical protein
MVYFNQQGCLHREDGPAVVYNNGTVFYYKDGRRHREDGPAAEFADGMVVYYINGHIHREDGPAQILPNGEETYSLYVGSCGENNFYAEHSIWPGRVNYRVTVNGHSLSPEVARLNWQHDPKCLELVEKAIAKFEDIKALIDKK